MCGDRPSSQRFLDHVASHVRKAFGAAVVEGLWTRVSLSSMLLIALSCSAILAAVLVLTWLAGRALGFSRADAIVLQFCGSKKSLASGIPMAKVIFASHAVSFVVRLPDFAMHNTFSPFLSFAFQQCKDLYS